jgi:hypothetical protein
MLVGIDLGWLLFIVSCVSWYLAQEARLGQEASTTPPDRPRPTGKLAPLILSLLKKGKLGRPPPNTAAWRGRSASKARARGPPHRGEEKAEGR